MTTGWGWVVANAAVVSAITSVGMLLIWGVYLQLMLYNFRKQRRPRIIINRGRGRDTNAICLISNMSTEAVFIEALIVRLETSKGTWYSDATDVLDQQGNSSSRRGETDTTIGNVTRQGPMESGAYMEAGMFGDLIQQVAREQGISLDEHYRSSGEDIKLMSIEVLAIGLYGSENGPVGAHRKFLIQSSGEEEQLRLIPRWRSTRQLRRLWHRQLVKRWQNAVQ